MGKDGGVSEHNENLVRLVSKDWRSSRLMTAVLVGLIVIALGLGVGIYFIRHSSIEFVDEDNGYYGAADALVESQEIWSRFENDADYSLDVAYSDYERLIEDSDNTVKNYILAYYADFVYRQTGEVDLAIEIMEKNENNLGDDGKVDYYLMLQNLYEKKGDNEKVLYCQEKIEGLMPVDVRGVEEMEEGQDG